MNYTDMESKVREATNDEAWGPTGHLMQELAQATFSYEYFPEVMSMLWRRMLVDNQTNWRRTYKSLVVLNYLIKNGAERVVTSAREHVYDLKSLENYSYVDETGKDNGQNVRIRVKQLIEFIQDDDALREERKKAKKNRDKYVGVSSDGLTSSNACGSRFNNSFSDSVSNFEDKQKEVAELGSKVPASKVTVDRSKAVTKELRDNDRSKEIMSVEKETSVTQPKPSNADLIMGSGNNLDLFASDSIIPTSDELNLGVTKPAVANISLNNNTDDIKSIVKNIDIFSSKRPRPNRTNRSSIPDLTLNNPNPTVSASGSMRTNKLSNQLIDTKDSVQSISQVNKTKDNILSDSLFEIKSPDSTDTVCQPSQSSNTLIDSKSPIDNFDLLSIGTVPSKSAVMNLSQDHKQSIPTLAAHTSNSQNNGTERKNLKIMDELSSLNDLVIGGPGVSNDDPFDIMNGLSPSQTMFANSSVKQRSSLTEGQMPAAGTLMPNVPITSSDVTVMQASSSNAVNKLPDSWNSLVSGTKFNIDLDNLLKPDDKKGHAPSLNQLAQSKQTTTNDDLFG